MHIANSDKPVKFYSLDIILAVGYRTNINDLLRGAKQNVVLIDNYIDDTVLTIFSKYPKLNFLIISKKIS